MADTIELISHCYSSLEGNHLSCLCNSNGICQRLLQGSEDCRVEHCSDQCKHELGSARYQHSIDLRQRRLEDDIMSLEVALQHHTGEVDHGRDRDNLTLVNPQNPLLTLTNRMNVEFLILEVLTDSGQVKVDILSIHKAGIDLVDRLEHSRRHGVSPNPNLELRIQLDLNVGVNKRQIVHKMASTLENICRAVYDHLFRPNVYIQTYQATPGPPR